MIRQLRSLILSPSYLAHNRISYPCTHSIRALPIDHRNQIHNSLHLSLQHILLKSIKRKALVTSAYTPGVSLPQPSPQATIPACSYCPGLDFDGQTRGPPPSPLHVSLPG